jgi:hypothetical protein
MQRNAFQGLNDNLVYVLGSDKNLWREQGDMHNRGWVDGNVAEFQALDNNLVCVLGTDGNLWHEQGDMHNRSWVDGNVAQFHAIDNHLVYVRGTDGNLWREQGDMHNRSWVDANVADFQPIDTKTVYVLGTDGNLWREQGDMHTRSQVDGNVLQFQALDSTLVFVLGTDGNLWRERGDMHNRSWVDGNVGRGGGVGAGGPIVADWNPIVFGGGVPVGGWANLDINSDGSYNFSGSFHDSGLPPYDVAIVFAVRSSKGAVFTFTTSGKVNGTIGGGSRDFIWDNVGNNGAIKGAWGDLAAGWSWQANAAANLNFKDLWNSIKAVIGTIQEVVAVVGPALTSL